MDPDDSVDDGTVFDVGELLQQKLSRMGALPSALQGQIHAIERIFRPFERLNMQISRLPAKQAAALRELAGVGWYIDEAYPARRTRTLARWIQEGEESRADEALCSHYEMRIDALAERIRRRFPHRAAAVRAGLLAHHRGEFYLSTPVLLAQVDGITVELAHKQLYMRNGTVLKQKLEGGVDEEDRFLLAYLTPLLASFGLTAGPDDRAKLAPKLNRHEILHGERSDYGTREVSARALSLLAYVSWILNEFRERNG